MGSMDVRRRGFDLNLLPVLDRIYEHGSVSGAAQDLGLSQSAVSAALARLRERYGDPRFHRVGHGMQPTPRMRALIDTVRTILAQVDGTFAHSRSFDPSDTETVFSLAMTDLGEMVFLPKILQRVRQLAPRASVRSVAASATHLARQLETGEIDLAVGYFPDLRGKAFREKHLFYHHFVCLLRSGHPVSAPQLSLAQFLAQDHAVVYGAGRTSEVFERYLKARKLRRRVVLETPHFMSLPMVIARSDLVATVPHAVGVFVRDTTLGLRLAQPPLRPPRIDLKMHWHRDAHNDARSRWLRGVVADLFTDELDEWREPSAGSRRQGAGAPP